VVRQPNVILIMSDQHSPHVLGCAQGKVEHAASLFRVVRTPTLDRLAERGVSFTNAYCANPLCVPSRMTFLTSRHCSDIRVWTNSCRLQSDIPTFVHHLVNAGYETILCGRMHFVGPDQRHGFERRIIGDVHAKLEHIPVSTTGQTADGVKVAGPGRTAYSRYDEEVTRVPEIGPFS
jgi:choline-sulfatase